MASSMDEFSKRIQEYGALEKQAAKVFEALN